MTVTRAARWLALLVVAGAGGIAGCGGDDDEAGAEGDSPKEAFCAVEARIDEAFAQAGQYASREQKAAAAKTAVDAGLLEEATDTAPEDIGEAVTTRTDAVRQAADGMTEALISEEALAADETINEVCGAN
ncbi:MAG: hypothetical protein ACRDY7_11095 [Acidimicrobiia bacterium]